MLIPNRRTLLAGGMATVVAAKSAQPGTAPPDHAARLTAYDRTAAPSATVSTPIGPSGDKTGATDTAAISGALAGNGSTPVLLDAGTFYLNQPLLMATGNTLAGSGGACQAAAGAGSGVGTILTFGTTWTPHPAPVKSFSWGVVTLITKDAATGAYGTTAAGQNRMSIRDLWIDFSAGHTPPGGVDGIVSWGAQNGVSIVNVGVYKATGNGFSGYLNTAVSPNVGPDGWYLLDCLAQSCGGTGIYGYLADTTLINVHAQNSGSNGFDLFTSNTRLICCRADISRGDGFRIESQQGGGGFLDAVTLEGCGTQRNSHYGLHVINSANNPAPHQASPVVATGCTFDGDGTNHSGTAFKGGGGWAGIRAAGQVLLTVANCSVLVQTEDVKAGCPQYAFRADKSGKSVPSLVSITGGFMNCQDKSAFYVNDAPAQKLALSNVWGSKGGQWTGADKPQAVT